MIVSPTGVADGGAEFSVAPTRNPITGPFDVAFSLANGMPASLAVFDVGGREIVSREVGAMGAGRHTVRLGNLPAGMYVVRLSQAGSSLSSRVAVLH
jgi:hypothetical protein